MPAKIRTIKATSIFAFETFDFNKSIEYQGESLGLIKLIERKPGIVKAKVYQDLNGDLAITKKDLIYKGKIKDTFISDDLTNFFWCDQIKKTDAQMRLGDAEETRREYYLHQRLRSDVHRSKIKI